MAKEWGPLKLNDTGRTDLGLVIFKRGGQQWNFTSGAYAAVDVATAWTDKVVALTDAGSGWYFADIASGDPSDPQAEFFIVQKQSGSFAATDPVIASGAFLSNVLNVPNGVETGMTWGQAMKYITATLLGKTTVSAGQVIHRDVNDTANRVTSTVDASGQRSAVTLNAS